MDFSAKDKIVLTGAPFGYVQVVDEAVGTIGNALTFSNLQSVTYKLPKVESETESTENIDITRADGAVIRFPKTAPTISGVDGKIVAKDATGTATGKGEVTMVINEAPDEITSWTAFMNKLKEISGKLLYITVPTGLTYSQRNTIAVNKKVDGWIHMLGRINNDLENQLSNSNATVSITVVSHLTSADIVTDLTSPNMVFPEISFYLGGSGKDVEGIKPPVLSSNDADLVRGGDIVIVPTAA